MLLQRRFRGDLPQLFATTFLDFCWVKAAWIVDMSHPYTFTAEKNIMSLLGYHLGFGHHWSEMIKVSQFVTVVTGTGAQKCVGWGVDSILSRTLAATRCVCVWAEQLSTSNSSNSFFEDHRFSMMQWDPVQCRNALVKLEGRRQGRVKEILDSVGRDLKFFKAVRFAQ